MSGVTYYIIVVVLASSISVRIEISVGYINFRLSTTFWATAILTIVTARENCQSNLAGIVARRRRCLGTPNWSGKVGVTNGKPIVVDCKRLQSLGLNLILTITMCNSIKERSQKLTLTVKSISLVV